MKNFVKGSTAIAIATTENKLDELRNLPAGTLGKRRAINRETAKLAHLTVAASAQAAKHIEAPNKAATKSAPKAKVAPKTKTTKAAQKAKVANVDNASMADAPSQYAKQVIWESEKVAQKEAKEASKAPKITPVDTAKAEVAAKEAKVARKAAKNYKANLGDAAEKAEDKTRRERIAAEKAEKVASCVAAMKQEPDLFALPKKVATEVAELLCGLTFDVLSNMACDDLRRIKGIGPKYAEVIFANRYEYTGKLAKLCQYEVKRDPRAPMVKERVLYFNDNWYKGSKELPVLVKTILRPESELDRHMRELGYDPEEIFVTVIGYIKSSGGDKVTYREQHQKDMWDKWCLHGLTDKLSRVFVMAFHGTNAGRLDKVRLVRSDVYREAVRYARLGARWGAHSTEAKEAGYMGLVMPGTIRFSDYVGIDIQPEHIVFVPSYKKVFKGQHVDFVDVETGTVSIDVVRDVVQNMGDGQMHFHLSDKLLSYYLDGKTPEEKREICAKLRSIENFSARAQYMKGLCVTDVDFHAVFRKLGVKFIKTSDGRVVDIEDIAILADETVFKASIGEDTPERRYHFRSWAEYCANWHKYNAHFCVLIREHADRPHALPFQQLQSMVGCDIADIGTAVDGEVEYLNGYTDPKKASHLVGGEMSRIVKNVPALHRHPWVVAREQAAYDKLYAQANGGVLHNTTHNVFGAFDPIAYMQHVTYVASDISEELQEKHSTEDEYVTGAIPAHTIVSRLKARDGESEEEAVFSRNPSTDPAAQCVVKVQKDFGEWEWAFRWSTLVYTSAHSYEVTKVRGDHDGDHFFITFNRAILAMARRANELWGGRLIDWDAPSTPKHAVWCRDMQNYYKTLNSLSQLGYFADLLTSLVGYGPKAVDYSVMCWLVMAVNVFVDASKHGMGNVSIPDAVLDFLSQKDKDGKILRDQYGNRMMRPMPLYSMWAKDSHHMATPEDKKKIHSSRCAVKRFAGNGDQEGANVERRCPKQLVVKLDPKFEKLDVRELQYNLADGAKDEKYVGYRGCEELFSGGTYNNETGKRENQGLWIELCFSRMRELQEICSSFDGKEDNRYAYAEAIKSNDALRRFVCLDMLTKWGEAHGKTIEDIHDAVTHYTFALKRPEKAETEKERRTLAAYNAKFEAWVAVFGGLALRAIYLRDNGAAPAIDEQETDIDDSFIADLLG